MNKKELSDLINTDMPEMGPVTKETVEYNKGLIGCRKPYTNEEYEARRTRVLNTPLP